MLIGKYQTKLGINGRCALPAIFRGIIGENGIIAKWYEGCLVITGIDGWNALLDKLTGKSEIYSTPVRETDRFILGSAFEVNLDSQGRFVIPKVLRAYAKLSTEVIFIGLGNRVELWDLRLWQIKEQEVQKNASDMIEKLETRESNQRNEKFNKKAD